MTSTRIAHHVRRWFVKAGQAMGPVLPDGWFGRPYDNLYSLEDVEVAGRLLTIRLSGRTVLVFDELEDVYLDESELVFAGFRAFSIQWTEHDGLNLHQRTYNEGEVRLVPPIGTTVAM